MLKNSPVPLWVTLFLIVLALFQSTQVFTFYFDHEFLVEAGISTQTDANLNVIYATAGRMLATIVATVFVIILQSPPAFMTILLMSMVREGQEMIIQPLFPYANSPASPTAMFILHALMFAIEFAAFITVLRKYRST